MLEEKLRKLENIIKSAGKKAQNISKEDIECIEDYYKYDDGTVFTSKMINDFKMWKSFENDYGIDKIGIAKLRNILGEPKEFKQKYIS